MDTLTVPIFPQFGEALAYASAMHATQSRKSTQIPYISHLLAVASIVLEAGGKEHEAIAALLHDGPEDQGGQPRLDDIRRTFGDRVAEIVAHCSDTFESPKPPWEERKRAYIEKLKDADCSVKLVSLADKLHNARATLRDIDEAENKDAVWSRFSATREQSIRNYRSLIEAYRFGGTSDKCGRLIQQLETVVDQLEQGGSHRSM